MNRLKGPFSHFSSFVLAFILLSLFGSSFALAQVVEVIPIIEIDKKIVTDDEPEGVDALGEVLVGTPIFFKYRVSYTGYITSTGTVTVTVPITDTLPVGVGIDLLTIRDDMGTLNPDNDFACVRTTGVITGTIPVATTIPFTTTLPIENTVIISGTNALNPGESFDCFSSSGIFTDTVTGFTPKSGLGYYRNIAVATVGPCAEGCESDTEDDARYTGLYAANTPGYWKNHPESWPFYYDPISSYLGDVFVFPDDLEEFVGMNFGQALRFKGGKGLPGATRILLRSAVASWLNASFHVEFNASFQVGINGILSDCPNGPLEGPDGVVYFPHFPCEIQRMVKVALATGDRSIILMRAEKLDEYNNGIDIMSIYDY